MEIFAGGKQLKKISRLLYSIQPANLTEETRRKNENGKEKFNKFKNCKNDTTLYEKEFHRVLCPVHIIICYINMNIQEKEE